MQNWQHGVWLLLGCATLSGQGSDPLPADRTTGAATISAQDLRIWLTKLTSPEFAGRGTGQEGFRKAAEMMRAHFQASGLQPGFGKDYFQQVPWKQVVPDPAKWAFDLSVQGGKKAHRVEMKHVHGSLVRGLTARGRPYVCATTDVTDLPLEGSDLGDSPLFVLVNDRNKLEQRARDRALRNLARAAKDAKASMVVVVWDVAYHASAPLSGISYPALNPAARGRVMRGATTVLLDRKRFGEMLAAVGTTTEAVARHSKPQQLDGELHLDIQTSLADAPAFNVAAVLPGSDEKLASEYVIVGCHLDHLGRRGATYFPGADDDGSGSVGLMAISRAFAKNAQKPRRSLMFVAFCGEEMGLIGSGWFARNPPVPLEKVAGELQIDMIGRDEENERRNERAEDNRNSLHLVGTKKLSPALHDLCMRLNGRAKFDLEFDEENVFGRSDHFNFARQGVPIAFFFTGFHRDYHRPTDTVEKINFPKLARVARYVYDIAFELAQSDTRPLVDADLWEKMRGKARETPAAGLSK
ncbi:MAG: M20/M25/M40 family metallo-hydrolase [Planctomycetes bacterium]|nr:M20/M25/M40 family metallo-hydrolase [Planctomycetota bacterium]MCB9870005.1 M20/M25/M40 family metallo-hydrolase [Planctomycetota bacterium]